jgi:hypothetical protein
LLNYSQNKKLRKVLGVIKSMYRSAKGSEGIDWPTCFFETFCQYLGGSFKGGGKHSAFCGIEFGTDHN